jgi:hypothetical protein
VNLDRDCLEINEKKKWGLCDNPWGEGHEEQKFQGAWRGERTILDGERSPSMHSILGVNNGMANENHFPFDIFISLKAYIYPFDIFIGLKAYI